MHQAEEDLLVLAAQAGNRKAFNLIVKRYHQPLLRFAFKICGDEQIAQDAVQESWIKTTSGIRKLDDPRVLKSWLYRLVRWRTTDIVRKSAQINQSSEEFDESQYAQQLESTIDQSEELEAAISRLPPLEKQMIHLFYLDELKVSEIASVLETPIGTIKSRLNRARKLLKQKFEL
ncbi:RNA polymerase sigma factor [Aliikangiella marina]|uniref:RNA polymerase sigma factor n=1 Tax=Aliikangiella marina TaxID=1712262 RepID=A0A545T4Q6_9GAMM|nr:RNA polymerase sigma factor [Aliikangiella marina]TQV72217.1 RNA polymerase sigma factor [Aliikangiella marina]